jgi:carbamoyl-phosphate synthase small subunit
MKKKAVLVLEDGAIFEGTAFGALGEAAGEVVFNTSMLGYQEILTDPSYAGLILAMSYPHIGNCGVNSEDYESRGAFLEGLVVREYSRLYSNWRAEGSLEEFLINFGIVGVEGIDTRALTRHIRDKGSMKAVLSSTDLNQQNLMKKTKKLAGLVGRDLVKDVTVEKPYIWWETKKVMRFNVVALDFGITRGILRCLESIGCKVMVMPASTSAKEILSLRPDGIVLSSGPGDPTLLNYAVETVGNLLGNRPVFGIGLGHLLLTLATDLKTRKMRVGHFGSYPVRNLETDQIEITTQSHGFVVEAESSSKVKSKTAEMIESKSGRVEVTYLNLHDGTIEGLRFLDTPALSVQFYPKVRPSVPGGKTAFDGFVELMEKHA